jgi:hypothetical protein
LYGSILTRVSVPELDENMLPNYFISSYQQKICAVQYIKPINFCRHLLEFLIILSKLNPGIDSLNVIK